MPVIAGIGDMANSGCCASEEWSSIEGYGFYAISSCGRMQSAKRQGSRGGLLKTPVHPKSGHPMVSLYEGGKDGSGKLLVRRFYVHQLVAASFIGPAPDHTEVCHLDDVPSNNHCTNLYYGTHQQNMNDYVRNGHHPLANRTHCDNGHEFTDESTHSRSNGKGRRCIICQRDYNRSYYATHRGLVT